MKQSTSSLIEGQKDQAPSPARLRGRVLKLCVVILALTMVFALSLFRIYGVDTHHASRGSIWWPERGRSTATEITMQWDLLDHYATYTVSEKDLNAFLDNRFASDGEALDSFSERDLIDPRDIGNVIGRLEWIVREDTVVYHFSPRVTAVFTPTITTLITGGPTRALRTGRSSSFFFAVDGEPESSEKNKPKEGSKGSSIICSIFNIKPKTGRTKECRETA